MDLAGLRDDGRRANEIREISIKIGLKSDYDGSAYIEIGQTKALAQVLGPHEVVNKRLESHERAVIVVEYAPAPFAGLERKRRRVGDREGVELALAVEQALSATVMVANYPNTQIDVFLTVLQDDGGRLPACLNVACLAIIDAGIAVSDMLVASSAGFIKEVPVVDLNFREQGAGGPYLPVAIHPSSENIVLAQMDSKLPLKDFESVLRLGINGCHQVHQVMQGAVRRRTEDLLAAREFRLPDRTIRHSPTADSDASDDEERTSSRSPAVETSYREADGDLTVVS
jgi:exosome complex component RRP41